MTIQNTLFREENTSDYGSIFEVTVTEFKGNLGLRMLTVWSREVSPGTYLTHSR